MKEKTFNNIFNAFILVGMLVAVVALNVLDAGHTGESLTLFRLIAGIGAFAGVINIVLSANGSIWNYLFGFIDVAATIAITLERSIGNPNPLWGQFILHAAYLLPMQFVGIWQWRKRGATSARQVQATRLKPSQWALFACGFVVAVPVLYYLLNVFGNAAPEKLNPVILADTVVVSLCVLGQVLMAFAFMDQWIIWILVNICSIALYFLKSRSSDADSYTVVYMVKYIFYFINSLNGLRIWLSLSRSGRDDESV